MYGGKINDIPTGLKITPFSIKKLQFVSQACRLAAPSITKAK
jgi:hypothetical protein